MIFFNSQKVSVFLLLTTIIFTAQSCKPDKKSSPTAVPLTPPSISSTVSNVSVRKDSLISDITFSSNKSLTSCEMTPQVDGLTIESTTCKISGSPTEITSINGIDISVTATGAGGVSNSASINLKVHREDCQDLTSLQRQSSHRGDGTSGNPYIICGSEGIASFLYSVRLSGHHFKMGSDVDFGGSQPSINAFQGSLDGAGHSISGMNKNMVVQIPYGLFNRIASGNSVIKRITFENNSMVLSSTMGTIAGTILGGASISMSDIVVRNSTIGNYATYPGAGILFGESQDSNFRVTGNNILIHDMLPYINTDPTIIADIIIQWDRSLPNETLNGEGVLATGFALSNVYHDLNSTDDNFRDMGFSVGKTYSELINSSTYTGFDASNWDLSPLLTGSPATLIKHKDKIYSDGIILSN